MSPSSLDKFHELSFYTLDHPDKTYFIHQHIVDAWQAQTADENTKPIAITFSLIGLYLYLEKTYTGRQVQLAHSKLSQNKKAWPKYQLPNHRGDLTVSDVVQATPGQERDSMIKDWCASVWGAYRNCHDTVASLVKSELGI
jgi:hypothetical protein